MSEIKIDSASALPTSLPQKSNPSEAKDANKKPPRRRPNRDRKHTKSLNVDVATTNGNKKQQPEQPRKQQQLSSSSSNKTDNNVNSIKINLNKQNSNEAKKSTGSSDLSSSLNETNIKVE